MITDDLRHKLQDYFTQEIQGGVVCTDYMQIFDEMIEEGVISGQEFYVNELEICHLFDNDFFICDECSWIFPRACESEIEQICENCYEEEG